MFAHLLVPTDGTKLSDKALAHAVALAKATKAKITLFHASPATPVPVYTDGMAYSLPAPREYVKQAKEDAAKLLERAAAVAKKSGVPCGAISVQAEAPWEAILAAAKKAKADTIVMASHGRRGLASLLLGSETTKVLTHSKLPVVVVR